MQENLSFVARAYNIPHPKERIAEVVEQLGLKKRLHQLSNTLSGGWKQKLALAAALLHKPQLLLLDEPTAGVDPDSRREFWRIIDDISAEGITVLVTTHYMDEAERCHRILYLAYGNLIVQGTIHDIIANSHLSSWQVYGENTHELAKELIHLPGVSHVIPFGMTLHVLGRDKKLLLKSLYPYLLDLRFHWRGIDPTLEDIFINLISELKEKRFD